jgi:hypothetical protein
MTDHPQISRRTAVQAGSVGLLGLGMNHLTAFRAMAGSSSTASKAPARSVIYVFLSGGLAQQDSFDMKPESPDAIRGEFSPIATSVPGLQVCEHLPELAKRSDRWALVRSLTHPYNEHFEGHMAMLTGRTMIPPGFGRGHARPTDWPSISSIAGVATTPRNNLPPAVILPEQLRHKTNFAIGGQFGGQMGAHRDPWTIAASPFRGNKSSGAFPGYAFNHLTEAAAKTDNLVFEAPNLSLPEGIGRGRLSNRLQLLNVIEQQRRELESHAEIQQFDRTRQGAVSLLSDKKVKWAFDVTRTDDRTQDRYGRNSFGWSMLMARRLVEVGVNCVQVNLGNYNSWDTHGANFPKLKDFLLPPTDLALSALIDDLDDSGLLESTLIVMAGEFGRTPKISRLPRFYKYPGRDHWGAVQSAFLAGGGIRGGTVVGSSDKTGGYPASDPQTPEALAATIYSHLGIPRTAAWQDEVERPTHIYHGTPIPGLT